MDRAHETHTRRRVATRYSAAGSGPTNDKRIVPDRVGAVYFCTRDRPLPTTACDGCSPGLPLTTNPPLVDGVILLAIRLDPDTARSHPHPGVGTVNSRQCARTEGSVLPCGGLRRPGIRVRLTRGHPVSLSLPLRRARRPGMGEHP